MSIAEVTQLPLREKLQLLEVLWEDLSGRLANAEVPETHRQLLDQRRVLADSGEMALHDWDEVKGLIGRR